METDKIENMLSQLIKMVGTMHSEQNEMKVTMHSELTEMKSSMQEELIEMKSSVQEELTEMKSNLQAAENKNEPRHKEIIDHLKALENDQDFIWEKSVRSA